MRSATDLIIGVDEAGRGPLAGPVTAAAVLLDPARPIAGLDDSKRLSEKQRDVLAPLIRTQALSWAVVHVDCADIERLNILRATLLGMTRALQALVLPSGLQGQSFLIQIDGNQLPDLKPLSLAHRAETIIGGDALVPAISAASILAKTTRDALMMQYDAEYPGYGFALHKGYGTAMHLESLRRLGPCPIHRQGFAPVRAVLDKLQQRCDLSVDEVTSPR